MNYLQIDSNSARFVSLGILSLQGRRDLGKDQRVNPDRSLLWL
jgi:hypothetical protein